MCKIYSNRERQPQPHEARFLIFDIFGESSLLGMNYSTREGVCSTQRGDIFVCDVRSHKAQPNRLLITKINLNLSQTGTALVTEYSC